MNSLDSVRSDVKFALTCQPTQSGPAIDGRADDFDNAYDLSYYIGKVPNYWVDLIADRLLRRPWHVLGKAFKYNMEEHVGALGKVVDALEFHEWVAYQVKAIDPTFKYEAIDPRHSDYEHLANYDLHHEIRNDQAQAIRKALVEWVAGAEDKEDADPPASKTCLAASKSTMRR